MKEQDAADWLALRNLLWLADDHASEIEQYFSGGLEGLVEVLIARDATGA
ncbi:TPA: AAC(6') family aminoglycoside N-acetyltransferase, partial [Pseudomonas aeruginosa]|nr:AAC(6') family aminoglycoside N-acetyltransferase [Pseudomonas aeruginosa]